VIEVCSDSEVLIEHLEFLTTESPALEVQTSGANVTIRDTFFVPGTGGDAPGLSVSDGVTTCELCLFRNGASPGVTSEGNAELMLIESMVYNNIVTENPAGGGMRLNGGSVVLLRSTVASNRVSEATGEGGGIVSQNTDLALINSTIASNQASRSGGGIFFSQGTLTLRNATIAGNVANSDKSASSGDWFGGGLQVGTLGIVLAENSLVADNEAFCDTPGCAADWFGADCAGLGMDSYGYNLITHSAGCIVNPITLNPDLLDVNSLLSGSVTSNGGPTWTMALMAGSMAIDGGNPAGCTDDFDYNPGTPGDELATDQRLVTRPQDGDDNGSSICDIGAYELEGIERPELVFSNGFEDPQADQSEQQ